MAKKEKAHYFPSDIIFKILVLLPGTSVIRFKSVCKLWNSIISTKFFIESHLKNAINAPIPSNILLCYSNRASLVDTETWSITNTLSLKPRNADRTFGGSCNGLACFYNNSSGGVLVINPTTRVAITFPKPIVENELGLFSYTLGFVPSTNEYKVVYFYTNNTKPFFEIRTIGDSKNKSWRKSPRFNNCHIDFGGSYPRGILSNGILYWIGRDRGMNRKPWILSFDLKLEKIRSIDILDFDQFEEKSNDFILGELNGNVSVTLVPDFISPNEKRIYIYIMNNDEKEVHDGEQWARKLKLFVPGMSFMRPLFINGEKILLQDECNEAGLYYYDLENNECEKVYMGDYDFCYHAYPHVNSLLSLEEL